MPSEWAKTVGWGAKASQALTPRGLKKKQHAKLVPPAQQMFQGMGSERMKPPRALQNLREGLSSHWARQKGKTLLAAARLGSSLWASLQCGEHLQTAMVLWNEVTAIR